MFSNLNDIFFKEFRCSFSEKCLFYRNQVVPLTGKEFAIFALLLQREGKIVNKADICQEIWQKKEVEESNLFHHISALRKKLLLVAADGVVIDTIAGIGYRLVISAVTAPPPAEQDAQVVSVREAAEPAGSKRLIPGWVIGIAVVAGCVAATAIIAGMWRSGDGPGAITSEVLTSPAVLADTSRITEIAVAASPSSVVLSSDENQLYIAESANNSVAILDVRSNQVVDRVKVGSIPCSLILSPDGRTVLIAQAGGGVGSIDTLTHLFRNAPSPKEPVFDIALTSDGTKAYLALGFLGVGRLNLANGSLTIISRTSYARALAITPDSRRLYVSYQNGGPGGSPGHDAIGYFNTASDKYEGADKGFANVGECLSASPDSLQIWENGEDACEASQYSHQGCPFVPAGVLNVLSVKDNHVRAFGVRGVRLQCVTFSPDGEYAAVGATDRLLLFNTKPPSILVSLPFSSTGRIAFTRDGLTAYAPSSDQAKIAAIKLGSDVHAFRLAHDEKGNRVITLAIPPGANDEAKSIDPGSLTLDGVSVTKSESGLLSASIEHLAGFPGHSLVVNFNLDKTRTLVPMQLKGKTYSGFSISSKVE